MPFCASCGTEARPAASFCANCGKPANGSSSITAQPSPTSERVIFNQNGVFVSNSRYIVGGQTYAMAGVTSVKMFVEQPSRTGPVIAMAIGCIFALGGLNGVFRGNPLPFLFGAGLFLLGLWIFRKRVPIYSVVLHSASGEQRVNQSAAREFVEEILGALNQAIVARG